MGDQGETNQHNNQSRRGQGGQGKTSAMDNVDHPWKARCIWVLLEVGEEGGSPCVGAALLQTKTCKQRSVGGGGGGSADVAGGDCRSADGLIQRLLQKTQISSAHRATIHHGAPRVLARQDQWKFLIFLTPKTIVRHDKNESTMVNYGRQIPNTEVKSCLLICRTLY